MIAAGNVFQIHYTKFIICSCATELHLFSIQITVDQVDYVADSNYLNFHQWRDLLSSSPDTLSTSPALSFASLSSTGSEQDHSHQLDIFPYPPSPDSLPAFGALSTTISALSLENGNLGHSLLPHDGVLERDLSHQLDILPYPPPLDSLPAFGALSATISALSSENSNVGYSLLPHGGMIPYNGSSSAASSYGFPSPTPSNASSYFSDSGWEDSLSANHTYHSNSSAELLPQSPLGTNNSSEFLSPYEETFSAGPLSSANHSYHSNGSAELLPHSPLGTNNPSEFPSPYEETSSGPLSSANHSYHSNGSAELLPQSPLGTNNPSGFLSPYEETFSSGSLPGIPGSSDQLLLSLSAPSPDFLTGVGDPWNDEFLSSLDWDQIFHPGPESPYLAQARSLSQPEFTEGSSLQPNPCRVEAPDPKVIKSQVATDAAIAVSEKKRKNPAICTCIICGRGFTRKHSRACKHHSIFRFLRLELISSFI